MSGEDGEPPDEGTDDPGESGGGTRDVGPDESAAGASGGEPDETAEDPLDADPDSDPDPDASVADDADKRESADAHVDDGSGQRPPTDVEAGSDTGRSSDGEGGAERTETLAADVDEQRSVEGTASPEDATYGTNDGQRSPSVPSSGQTDPSGTTGQREPAGTSGQRGPANSTGQQNPVETTVTRERGENGESLLAGLLSFVIPGLGNMLNGQTERGLIILVLWFAWLVVGWGIGFFLIGSIITIVTFGLGFILWMLIGFVVGAIELAIHVVAAVDAYQQSELVDNVTVKVNEVRGN